MKAFFLFFCSFSLLIDVKLLCHNLLTFERNICQRLWALKRDIVATFWCYIQFIATQKELAFSWEFIIFYVKKKRREI